MRPLAIGFMDVSLLFWIPALPLGGFVFCFLLGKRLGPRFCVPVAVLAVVLAFAVSLRAFFELQPAEGVTVLRQTLFPWIQAGGLDLSWTLLFDRLSGLYLLIICGVGALIHIYSVGYMRSEAGICRFFAYLNLFIFFMTLLVLGSSLLVLFIGWEGVGLCSYLLIGYDFHRQAAAKAAKKAFVFNRVGDFGLIVASLILFWQVGTLDLLQINERAAEAFGLEQAVSDHATSDHAPSDHASSVGTTSATLVATSAASRAAESHGGGSVWLIVATLLLFLAAAGKSAQIPLYVWLPDAMEGPTPVSALIHAATMVTAGLYLLARLHTVFALAPLTQAVILGVGTATAFFAATIALVQTDIKKVLAYSTVSQLGYMFMAMGAGAYLAGIFHVMTHAFFKALLFLAAGSVIHALHHEQDMRKMGGLLKKMPLTGGTYLIGALAISGFPLLTAGFFSKDEILWRVFSAGEHGYLFFWIVGLLTAALTAFYMFRSVGMTFFGTPSASVKQAHESPPSMTIPLLVLAALSLVGGWLGIPAVLGDTLHLPHVLENYFHGFFDAPGHAAQTGTGHEGAHSADHQADHQTELLLTVLTTAISLLAMYSGYRWFAGDRRLMTRTRQRFTRLHTLLSAKYYVDEAYTFVFVRGGRWLCDKILWRLVDVRLIDGLVNAVGLSVRNLGTALRLSQSGVIDHYALAILIGAVGIIWYLVF